MDASRFDSITRFFASRRLSRRQALATGGAGIAATGLAAVRLAAAQDATPGATPAVDPNDPHPSADTAGAHPEFLFVQPFDSGTWSPIAGADATYTLTLTGAAASTVYFSDRPERIVGLTPTQRFLDALGFTPDNPPNAALVATQEGSEEQEILVIELLNPAYDAAVGTLVYEARVLADYGEPGLAHLARQQTDYELPAAFGAGSLFIDDCGDGSADCLDPYTNAVVGTISGLPFCWNYQYACCAICSPAPDIKQLCTNQFGTKCTHNTAGTYCNFKLHDPPDFGC